MNYKRLVTIFLTLVSLSAQAEQRWFEIELLLFQRNVDIKNINEHLSSQQIVVDSSNSITLLNAKKSVPCLAEGVCLSKANPTVIGSAEFNSSGNGFQRLSSSRLRFSAQRQRLEKHAGFKPLLHMAWRMPVARGTSARPIHIFAGRNLALSMENSLSDKWEIDGNFKIYLDHYLYIDSQLIIRKKITEQIKTVAQKIELSEDDNGVQIAQPIDHVADNNATVKASYQTVIKEILFDQNRRLRSEEIHYLDHPLMGIIVQIRKIR
ncbi:MAG: peptidoglycan binding protein CsiV [Psychromonas sp.]